MRVKALVAMLVTFVLVGAAVLASQALAGNGKGGSTGGSGNKYVTVVTGSDPAGAVESVDGVPAAQAPGTLLQAVTAGSGPAASPGKVMPLTPSGCLNAGTNWQAGLDAVGATVWKIWNHTHWCFSNWQVTSVTGWTDVYTGIGWGSSNIRWNWAWWNQPATARSYSQAHFCLNFIYGCLQTADPTVNTWINGAGNYSFDDSNWYPGS